MTYRRAHRISCHTESWQSIGRRYDQEDRFFITPLLDGHLCLLMDGHGGRTTTEVITTHFVKDFILEFREMFRSTSSRDHFTEKQERQVLRKTIARQVERCSHIKDGTTLSLVYAKLILREGDIRPVVRVHAATMGDSPIAIWNGSRIQRMPVHSALHYDKDIKKIKSNIKKGKRRLVTRRCSDEFWVYRWASVQDGYVWRQRGGDHQHGVAMTRAIGDADLNGLLIRNPDIRTYDIPISGMVLLATDGILDDDSPVAVRQRTKQIIDKARMEDVPLDMIGKNFGLTDDNTTMVMMRWSGG